MVYTVIVPLQIKTKDGETISYIEGQKLKLPQKHADKLLAEGKIKAVDEFLELFDNTAKRIAKEYKNGAIEYAGQKKQDLINRSIDAENRINKFWCNDFENFKMAMNEFEQIQKEIVRVFEESQKYVCVLCGNTGERLMFNENKYSRYGWNWYCIKCKPYLKKI